MAEEKGVNLKDVFSARWGGAGRDGHLRDRLVKACRKNARVLLVDEAHTMAPDVCRTLLNVAQAASRKSPFILVLAGTPGLVQNLMSANATFVERSKMMGIGRLDAKSSAESIEVPLNACGIAIDEGAFDRAVKDAQRYPYFLQLWGEALWDIADERGLKRLSGAEVDAVQPGAREEGMLFYNRRQSLLEMAPPLLGAARAVAHAFATAEMLHRNDVLSAIEGALADRMPDAEERRAEALRLQGELERIDFAWRPTIGAEVEPGIPSFMRHVLAHTEPKAQKEHALDDGSGI